MKSIYNNSKTESKALNALEAIIDEHPTMNYSFNKDDKEMSWDGFITIYKDPTGSQSKENFDARIPVQIKGHIDTVRKYIQQKRISYPVSIDDLKAYATEKGVIYFQIFIDGEDKEIFYASLYPSRLADYIDKSIKKGNKNSINVVFHKMIRNPESFYYIVKQFDVESKKQGTAYTALVQNRIRSGELDSIKSINLTIVGENSIFQALPKLETGDICFYGQAEGDTYQRPIEWMEGTKYYLEGAVDNIISIDNKVWYNNYRIVYGSDGGIKICVSPNLSFSYNAESKQQKYSYNIVSSLKELYIDSSFLLYLEKSNKVSIGKTLLNCKELKIPEDMRKHLEFIIDLYELFVKLHLNTDIQMSLQESQHNNFYKLINISKGKYNNQLNDGLSRFMWILNDKVVPIIVNKKGDHIELYNAIYDECYHIVLTRELKKKTISFQVPLFIPYEPDTFAKIYYYDYKLLLEQINNAEANKYTAEELLHGVLNLICTYDINNVSQLLILAEALLHRIEPFVEKKMYLINCLQIKQRYELLSNDDIQTIKKIKAKNPEILFGKYVLLKNKKASEKYFEQMPFEVQQRYKKYPIYNLFKLLND